MGFFNVKFLTVKYPEEFTQDELETLRLEDYEVRQCDECGRLIHDGFCIDNGYEYYDSEECLHKHYTEREYLCMYHNIEYDEEKIESLSDEDFQNLVKEKGDEDNGWAYFTDWPDISTELIAKLQRILDEKESEYPGYVNSVLMEGLVEQEPYTWSNGTMSFGLLYYVFQGNSYDELRIRCECGPCVDEETRSKLRKGTTVSVLGRLKRFMGICIEAQHISIKDRRNGNAH